jgi:hypothetical protein
MFKKIEIVKDVKGFAIQNNILYYLNNKEKLLSNNQIVCDAYGIERNKKALFSFQNMYDVETKIIFNNDKIENTPYSLNADSFNGINTIIYNKNFNDFENQVGIYNIISKEIKWFSNIQRFGHNIRVENLLFYKQTHTQLRSLSLLTGEYEWEVDLGKYGEIRNILGVVNEELFVWLNNHLLVALSIQTGSVQWILDTAKKHDAYINSGIHFLPEEHKVVIFHEIYYIEIDISTRSSTMLYKSAFNKSWEFATSTVSGNYIYFTGRNYATGELSVGAFNRERLEVEWYYAAPEWQGTVPDDYEGNAVVLGSAPQVSDDKLYVLENGTGTLYIFERETVV